MTVLRLHIIRTLIKNLNKNSTNKIEHFIVEVTIYTNFLPFTLKKCIMKNKFLIPKKYLAHVTK